MDPLAQTRPLRMFIAGATGFVGSHLVRHVARQGHEVLALARERSSLARLRDLPGGVRLLRGDLSRTSKFADALLEFGPDVCVDCAWGDGRSGDTPSAHVASLGNALELAELVAKIGCPRYLHAGTCFEYAPSEEPLSEDDPTEPHTPYGACKRAAASAIALIARRAGRPSVAWPRIFYVYGPHEAPGRLVPAVIRGLLAGERTATTAGEQVRDYLHVEDVAAALWAIAGSDREGPVNVASGHAVRVRDIVETIARLVDAEELLDIGALPYRPEEPPAVRGDPSRLRDLGWRPRYGLEEGLRHTVEWWRGSAAAGGTA